MKKLVLLAVSLVAVAVMAQGIPLKPATEFNFTDCASGGSAAQTLTANKSFLMRVTDADLWVCYAATCATGGMKFPQGTVILVKVGATAQSTSCRSSASTGDVLFTLSEN